MRRASVLAVALAALAGCGAQSVPPHVSPGPVAQPLRPTAVPFQPGVYTCRGPGDPIEYGTLRLRRDGSYSYRESVPNPGRSGGRYRLRGQRIVFASGEMRTRDLYGVWQADRSGPWIGFRQRTGRDAGRPVTGFGGDFACGR